MQTDQTQTQDPQPITLGEKQYTQEELEQAVGIAEQAKELEERWNTRLDRLMPAYTQTTQQLSEKDRQIEELNSKLTAQITAKAEAGQEMTDDEQAKFVRENAKKYGLVTEDNFESLYQTRREAEQNEARASQLIGKVDDFVATQAQEGKPTITKERLVEYMDDNGYGEMAEHNMDRAIKNAYNEMFSSELDDWKLKQLSVNKPSGLYTQSQSTAGAKVPEEKRVTSENLSGAINDVMSRFQ